MTFRPAIWRPIAVVFSATNLIAVGFAASAAEPMHAALHAALALAGGLWIQRLISPTPAIADRDERLELLDTEVNDLRRELTEAQERLDFTERILARDVESRRVEPSQS